jgi:hypothetical protein
MTTLPLVTLRLSPLSAFNAYLLVISITITAMAVAANRKTMSSNAPLRLGQRLTASPVVAEFGAERSSRKLMGV